MTNPILVNSVYNKWSILWQYDKAPNLIKLLGGWNAMSDVSVRKFWDAYTDHILTIDPVYSGDETGVEVSELAKIDRFALDVWGMTMGILRPKVSQGGFTASELTESEKSFYENKIHDDLFRRLLKGRFFLMNRRPTVANYNQYLGIVFPNTSEPVTTSEGEIQRYKPRNRALDFGTSLDSEEYPDSSKFMSMGFTFPTTTGSTDKDKEEAYLIFEHYDLVYRFPAGIRTNSVFCNTSKVIGFCNQGLQNFSNGFAWAKDETSNGGILSATEKANYEKSHVKSGCAFVIEATNTSTAWNVNMTSSSTIWIDWGDGESGEQSGSTTYSHFYAQTGTYAVAIYYGSNNGLANDMSLIKYSLT